MAPPVIQGFITSGALEKFVESTQRKYGLEQDVAGRLSDETLMLMLGITPIEEITQSLTQEVLIRQEQLQGVLDDMNDQIFEPLRQAEKQGAPTGTKPAPMPPPAIGVPQPTAAIKVVAPQPPAPRPVTPPAPPAIPRPTPPVNLPGAMPPVPAPMPAPAAPQMPKPAAATPPVATQPSKNREELHDVLKSYGVDPYRETPE